MNKKLVNKKMDGYKNYLCILKEAIKEKLIKRKMKVKGYTDCNTSK